MYRKIVGFFTLLLVGVSTKTKLTLPDSSLWKNSYYDKISWFVHITDIHISSWEDDTRQEQLQEFVTKTLSILKPELVMCGGDLTEAKSKALVADQDLSEWNDYRNIVDSRWNNVTWLDIRGNHDNLNIINRNSSKNCFATHSVMGRQGFLHSYKVSLQSRKQKFNIIAIDGTWEVGMRYPFNFVGYIDDQERSILKKLVEEVDQDQEAVNLMFGHYPTSVVEQSSFIRSLISHGLVYLSGHLHDLYFFKMYGMYSYHQNRDLELELVDWKNNRRFRVLAVDDGKLSFKDVKYNQWPITLITNPKDIQFMLPTKENYTLDNTIRVLVFHNQEIKRVTVGINDEEEMEANSVDEGPLYILPWNADKYSDGVHRITVRVLDAEDKETLTEQEFTLNPKNAQNFSRFMSNVVLRWSFSVLFQTIFALTLIFNILIPVGLSLLIYLSQTGRLKHSSRDFFMKIIKWSPIRKLVHVVCQKILCWPLTIFSLYMALGPWTVGTLIEGHTGAIFAWGIIVNSDMVHSQVPFAYYFLHFAFIHPVMVLAIGHLLDIKHGQVFDNRVVSWCGHLACALGVVTMLAFSILLGVTFWSQFGALGIVFGPLKTWSYVFYGVMFFLAWRMGAEQFIKFNQIINDRKDKKNEDEENVNSDDALLG